MPPYTAADTVRILVSTDNHVGYQERDANRGDDSWKTFHEIMCLARERDVDMVLLAGDLFHENKPSRKSMYQVMRSLRMNCYGDKPCELEVLSDSSEQFASPFNHVNYEDPDINVAIPVFSIHGNHDDPSGEGHLAALDILQMSGLVNYYGRTPESDNIAVKPVLLQKGQTKLALYGLSNVRDERLFRTFRDGNVKFFQPSTAKGDWFNILSVHQNHHAYTETGYLPENFLPDFMDLVVWGHEHECLIDPRYNPETNFKVMQPGSSVATSLVAGEAVPKYVSILNIKGKDFTSEKVRLKTVRPFIVRDIALKDDRRMRDIAMQNENRPDINRYLIEVVEEMIKEASEQWYEMQREAGEEPDENEDQPPLPLIRLRVEHTAPEGGNFNVDNPQRFSNRFVGRVANIHDVVQFHRRRTGTTRKGNEKPEMPNARAMEQLSIDSVKVHELVREFLTAQSLTILPQNSFSDAVTQFIDKDDKSAMAQFVDDSLDLQVKHLVGDDANIDEEKIVELMDDMKAQLEARFAQGERKRGKGKTNLKPAPDDWDSDLDGHWEDNPAAIIPGEEGDEEDDDVSQSNTARGTSTRGRGRGRGSRAPAAGTTRKAAATSKKAPAKAPAKAKASSTRGKKRGPFEDDDADEDDDDDVIMLDDDDEDNNAVEQEEDEDDDDDEALFVQPAAPAKRATAARKAPAKPTAPAPRASAASKKASAASTAAKQTQLNFGASQTPSASLRSNGARGAKAAPKRRQEPSDDEISDDDDAFEPPPPSALTGRRR